MWRKSLIITAAATVLFAGYAAATGTYKKIEVYMDKVGLVLNGQEARTDVSAIVYNGTIYLPIRAIGESFGGEVTWDATKRAVNIDFVNSKGELVYNATQMSMYQYMLMEKNAIMTDMTARIKDKDYTAMKSDIERLHKLQEFASDFADQEAQDQLAKMAFSGEVIRSSLESKEDTDFELAVNLFLKSEADLTAHIGDKLSALDAAAQAKSNP